MNRCQTDRRSRWLFVFSGLFVFAALAGSPAEAKGPKSAPTPDFLVDFDFVQFEATGVIQEWGYVDTVDSWRDEDGVVWIRLRYHHGENDPSYFETVLPGYPEKRTEYTFELTAGPDGYLSGGVLYEGTFAAGTATGTTNEFWYWSYDYWLDKRVKRWKTEVYWDPLEVFLLR